MHYIFPYTRAAPLCFPLVTIFMKGKDVQVVWGSVVTMLVLATAPINNVEIFDIEAQG